VERCVMTQWKPCLAVTRAQTCNPLLVERCVMTQWKPCLAVTRAQTCNPLLVERDDPVGNSRICRLGPMLASADVMRGDPPRRKHRRGGVQNLHQVPRRHGDSPPVRGGGGSSEVQLAGVKPSRVLPRKAGEEDCRYPPSLCPRGVLQAPRRLGRRLGKAGPTPPPPRLTKDHSVARP